MIGNATRAMQLLPVRVGVVGAGAMGAGIALVAARAGHLVTIGDARADAIARAHAEHDQAMHKRVADGRMTHDEAVEVLARITYVGNTPPGRFDWAAESDLVIEAIVEDLAAKQALMRGLEQVVAEHAVLATNTSSLSVAAIAGACAHPERVLGLHFFNPAAAMPLVEVVPALATDPNLASDAHALMQRWGKTPVRASDTPGFIVNRVARPFYGEALALLDDGADIATIDWAMTELAGFKMGPFALMDFIGLDVNYAVTQSVFEAMHYDPRYRPHMRQRRLVESGWWGRKTGRGFYDYRDGAVKPEPDRDPDHGAAIVARIGAMLINEAVDAVRLGIASPRDLETAMTKGVNYPRGLLAWGDQIGPATVLETLDRLREELGERYRASPLLRDKVRAGERLLP